MSQTLGIKFRDHGQVYFFDSGPFVVRMGDYVIVRTDQGVGLGQVVLLNQGNGAAAGPVPAATLVQLEDAAPAPADGELAAFESLDGSAGLLDQALEPEALEPEALEPAAQEPPATDAGEGDASGFQAADKALKSIYRLASDQDLATKAENDTLARDAYKHCRRCIFERELDMKLVDVEVFFDRSKMVFYFTAPGRIDFRELVKDLVKAYRTRIELRQIGVRHETQMIGAVGNCGMVCCCRRYMRKFVPVTIKMAKEQNLFLNPTKISGICGRLLCCLAFEEKNYEEFYRQCPKIGKRLDTDMGVVKVLRANFFRGTLSVLPEYGEEKEFTVEEWKALNPRRYDPQAQPRRPAPEQAPPPPPASAEAREQDGDTERRGRPAPRRRPARDRGPAPVTAQNGVPAQNGAPAPDASQDAAPDQKAAPEPAPAKEQAGGEAARRPRPRRRRRRKPPRGEGQ